MQKRSNMNDNLDNELKNRIREVFDNYEDTGAHDGWLRLREKMAGEEPKRRIIAWWWYSAAAVLLLCAGLWFFYPQQVSNDNNVVKKTQPTHHTDEQADEENPDSKANDQLTANADMVKPDRSSPTVDKPAVSNKYSKSSGEHNSIASTGINADNLNRNSAAIKKDITVVAVPAAGEEVVAARKAPADHTAKSGAENPPVFIGAKVNTSNNFSDDKTNATAQPSIAKASPDADHVKSEPIQVATNTNQPADHTKKTDAVLDMINRDKQRQEQVAKTSTKATQSKDSKLTAIGVYAATYFNYAKGSDNQLNVGAGFNTDFKISKNLKLSTGIAIAQNSLNFNNNVPDQANRKLEAAAAASSVNKSFIASSMFSTVSTPVVQSYNASLIGLDIPINIKYQFNPQKSDTYVLVGISSGTYIDEKYQSAYSYANNSVNFAYSGFANVNTAATTTQENTSHQHFSTFDFAKTLNFSFGMGYPLGKRNHLIIEPFLKYPIDGLGSQDLKFGAGGVNLKLNFQTSGKSK